MTLDGRRGDSKSALAALLLIVLFVLSALACAQAGEVLTPEEATRRAQGLDVVEDSDVEVDTVEGLDVGDTAALIGQGFLINIFDEPGGRLVANQERGATVTIDDVREVEGELWYRITAPTGRGWVSADNLQAVVAEPDVSDEGADTETEGEVDTGDENSIAVGDVVFLTGRGFLINILSEPGGSIRATQERGAEVEVLERSEVDGTTWYRIDAPTGEGWVAAENLTAEAP